MRIVTFDDFSLHFPESRDPAVVPEVLHPNTVGLFSNQWMRWLDFSVSCVLGRPISQQSL
jgi:hypothetical protein